MRIFRNLLLAAFMLVPGAAYAHSPILFCFANEDGTVTCEAGYSDGASSAGQTARVLLNDQRLVVESKFDDAGTFTFEPPAEGYYVEFEGDTSHLASFYSEDIS